MGNPNGAKALLTGCRTAARASAGVRRAKAVAHATAVAPTLEGLMLRGLSRASIASELNSRGVPSASGGNWYAEQVRRTLAELGLYHAA